MKFSQLTTLTSIIVTLVCTLSAWAIPHFNDPDLNVHFKKIPQLEHKDSQALRKLRDLWSEKCEKSSQHLCTITEVDYLGNKGRPNRTLLFRGEAHHFKTSGISPIVRQLLAGNHFCEENCTFQTLNKLLNDRLATPLQFDFLVGPSTILTYDQVDNTWKNLVLLGEGMDHFDLFPLADLPNAKDAPASIKNETAVSLITTGHFQPVLVGSLDENRKFMALDPFVSLSRNPQTALDFSTLQEGNEKLDSRFLVISIPTNEILPLDAPNDCGVVNFKLGSIGNFENCNHGESYEEAELDSYLSIKSEYILDVINP